ncbi:MAG TPA: FAD-binding oxidoreductase [Candidatus Paceibacterota bacterium]|jgi:FAD/FMN-containing dehydrogenase|nr:FAD-binding oxidoreductase [Candidatus Paceibacterota bacterium]
MKSEIQKIFRGEVDDSEETLLKYSHDASLLEVMPQIVVYPMDSEDVKNLVKWVNENKTNPPAGGPNLSITARCAGTDMSGGAIGESIIMDFTRHMNKLIGGPLPMQNKDEWEICVQPGMFYRNFEKITLAKGLILPCYTASKSLNAMGGMYGNNSAGERTLKYGKTEDYILSAKIVFSDGNEYVIEPLSQSELNKKMAMGGAEGEIYRRIYKLIMENEEDIKHAKPNVHKNSAGYYVWNVMQNKAYFDLNKLLVGSQGTLGIVTEITFKIIPEIKYSKLVAIFMNDLGPLGRLVDEILELNPETLEAYDDKTMKLAIKFFPDFLKNKGFLGIFKLGWSFLPEFFMMLRGGLPKLIILAEFAGENEAEVNRQCIKLEEKIKDFKLKIHITKDTAEANKYWNIRRESFALLRKHIKGKRTAPFIDDIIVRPEFLPKFLPELNAILSKYKLTYTLAGHAGDGNFHIIPLMDFRRADTASIIMELGEKVYNLVIKYRGSITAEHNDGLIRTPYLQKMYEEKIIRIFREIKDIFDPKNIFNPGKKIATQKEGGTKEYIASHIAKEHKAVHRV